MYIFAYNLKLKTMAGCYGNDPFDRYWESQLDNYLDDQDNDLEDERDVDYEYEKRKEDE